MMLGILAVVVVIVVVVIVLLTRKAPSPPPESPQQPITGTALPQPPPPPPLTPVKLPPLSLLPPVKLPPPLSATPLPPVKPPATSPATQPPPPSYISPFTTNGSDGCVYRGEDGKCLLTACQVDVWRQCTTMTNNLYTDPSVRRQMSKECLLNNGIQCDLSFGRRNFECVTDPDVCRYAEMIIAQAKTY